MKICLKSNSAVVYLDLKDSYGFEIKRLDMSFKLFVQYGGNISCLGTYEDVVSAQKTLKFINESIDRILKGFKVSVVYV